MSNPNRQPDIRAIYPHSAELYAAATSAYRRTTAFGDRDRCGESPLVSVVFSAMAIEAVINEVAELRLPEEDVHLSAKVSTFRLAMNTLEQANAPLQLKFQFIKIALSGSEWDKGKNPFQEFDLLIKLRNAMVHMKPLDELGKVEVEGVDDPESVYLMLEKNAPLLSKFEDKNILSKSGLWLHRFQTPATSRWLALSHLKPSMPSSN